MLVAGSHVFTYRGLSLFTCRGLRGWCRLNQVGQLIFLAHKALEALTARLWSAPRSPILLHLHCLNRLRRGSIYRKGRSGVRGHRQSRRLRLWEIVCWRRGPLGVKEDIGGGGMASAEGGDQGSQSRGDRAPLQPTQFKCLIHLSPHMQIQILHFQNYEPVASRCGPQ